jgi:methylenetetrahydrofolate reductase (NADPH)
MMRDDGKFLSGAELKGSPKVFIGAAANPFGDPFELRVLRLAKKVKAGADFIQTQCIYNMDKFKEYMKQAVDMGLTEKPKVLAGITPAKKRRHGQLHGHQGAGLEVPKEIVDRIKGVPKESRPTRASSSSASRSRSCKEMPGVAGVHIMAIEWEHKMPEIMERSGCCPGPRFNRAKWQAAVGAAAPSGQGRVDGGNIWRNA